MNVLLMKWKGLGMEDMTEALTFLGHKVTFYEFSDEHLHADEKTEKEIKSALINSSADLIFSFNYYPILAKVCHDNDCPYFSWVYDSPTVLLYNYSLVYPTNHVFLFDYETYSEFKNNGINTVYYMPLAANPRRLQALFEDPVSKNAYENSSQKNKNDIAFVGSLYTEKHTFYDRLRDISPYTRGYLEGIMNVQKNIYGVNIIQKLLTNEIMDDMKKNLPLSPDPQGVETREYLFAEYVINRKITAIERNEILNLIGSKYKYDLYTPDTKVNFPGAINHGPVDYLTMTPFVFNRAKINLNITLRSIHVGIPLRAFEIIGCGGLLLSNYQPGFEDCFTAGEEYVPYESTDDLLFKIDYLLSHEDERKEIALNGYNRLVKEHTYDHRIKEMLSYL